MRHSPEAYMAHPGRNPAYHPVYANKVSRWIPHQGGAKGIKAKAPPVTEDVMTRQRKRQQERREAKAIAHTAMLMAKASRNPGAVVVEGRSDG